MNRLTISRKIAWSFVRPRSLFDAVRHDGSVGPAFGFLLLMTILDLMVGSGWDFGIRYRAYPHEVLPYWIVFTPLVLIAVISLSFVEAALVMVVVRLFRARIGFRGAYQALVYASPPASALALIAAVVKDVAPKTGFNEAVNGIALVWYPAVLTVGLSTTAQVTWPRVVVAAIIGAAFVGELLPAAISRALRPG